MPENWLSPAMWISTMRSRSPSAIDVKTLKPRTPVFVKRSAQVEEQPRSRALARGACRGSPGLGFMWPDFGHVDEVEMSSLDSGMGARTVDGTASILSPDQIGTRVV